MAFAAKDLSVLAYANGFTLWHYGTTEANTAIEAANYFNVASPMVRPGDMILSNTAIGSTPVGNVYIVSGDSAGTVSLTKLV